MSTYRIYRGPCMVREVQCADDKDLRKLAKWLAKRKASDPGTDWEVICVRPDGRRPKLRWGEPFKRATPTGDYDLCASYAK